MSHSVSPSLEPSNKTDHAGHSHSSHPQHTNHTHIKIKNSLGGQLEPLKLLDPQAVSLYVCGVTVYDHCHLGHARSAVAFDLIRKHLRRRVGSVNFVRNITDIDDKIIKRAASNGESWLELSERMTASMHEDFAALGCEPPTHEPKASEFIEPMITHIQKLIDQNHAYVAEDGGVWFDGTSWSGVGALSGRKPEDLRSEARVKAFDGKRHASDFVLWKPAKPNEPFWPSPWGNGRPGWHIECSAMSQSILGDSFDIHGGGEDLKFPHHECEICQSESLSKAPLALQWLHNGFVVLAPSVEGEAPTEMHKSSGNAKNIKSLLEFHPGEVIRLWILSAHYRQPLLFSEAAIESARKRLERFYAAVDPAKALLESIGASSEPDEKMLSILDNDFNSPQALVRMEELIKAFKETPDRLQAAKELVGGAEILGLHELSLPIVLAWGKDESLLAHGAVLEQAEALLLERKQAREQKNWSRADEVREELSVLGFQIEDTPAGSSLKPKF